jgi:hypothetical protein
MTSDLCEAFGRNSDGSWTCTKRSVITVGGGQTVTIEVDQTVRRGELFGDYDLAAFPERFRAPKDNAE